MKVRELIKKLEKYKPEIEVVVSAYEAGYVPIKTLSTEFLIYDPKHPKYYGPLIESRDERATLHIILES